MTCKELQANHKTDCMNFLAESQCPNIWLCNAEVTHT